MSKEDYIKAQRMGKRDYQLRMMKGLPPTLEVLDDILPLSEAPAPETGRSGIPKIHSHFPYKKYIRPAQTDAASIRISP